MVNNNTGYPLRLEIIYVLFPRASLAEPIPSTSELRTRQMVHHCTKANTILAPIRRRTVMELCFTQFETRWGATEGD